MSLDYVTVGGISLDWVMTANGEVNHRGCGGNALYSAIGAHLWGRRTGVVSRAGQDFPDTYLVALAQAGIDTSGVRRMDEPHELVAYFRYDRDGNRHVYYSNEVRNHWGSCDPEAIEAQNGCGMAARFAEVHARFNALPDEVPPDYWQARGFHLASMVPSAQFAFVAALNARSIAFTIDPSTRLTSQEAPDLLRTVSVFLPSEREVERLLGEAEPAQAVERLAALGPEVVVIKLGRRGSLVYDARTGKRFHVPVYTTRAKDPTGAGDAFCGGFLVGWIETRDALEATLRGSVSASFVIEEFDARYSLRFGRQDAEERLSRLRAMIP